MGPRLAALLCFTPMALATGQLRSQEPLPVLKVGQKVEVQITAKDPVIHTKILDARFKNTPTRARSYRLQVEMDGGYMIDLRSHLFDAYLVLRDSKGNVLSEDDNGLLRRHARIVARLKTGTTYTVDACALRRATGSSSLLVVSGRREPLRGRARRAAELADARACVLAREARFGKQSRHLTFPLNQLGTYLWRDDRFAEALPVMQRCLSISEKTYGPDHVRTASACFQLAAQLRGLRRWGDAEKLYRRALATYVKINSAHPNTARTLDSIADMLVLQGKYEQAEPFCRRALTMFERLLGPGHRFIAISLNRLVAVLRSQGKHRQAERCSRRAVKIWIEVAGPEHRSTAISLESLARALHDQGKYEQAEPFYRRALEICKKQLGPKDLNTAAILNNLAALLKSQGKYTQADPLFRHALNIYEDVLGPNHVKTAVSLSGLAQVLGSRGNLEDAERLHRRALVINEQALGPDHPTTAASLNNLAFVHFSQGTLEKAEQHLRRALKIREKSLGPEHPDTATSLNSLAVVLQRQGRREDALPLHRRALQIRKKVLGLQHPDTARSLVNLGPLEANLGLWDSAWTRLAKAVSVSSSNLQELFAVATEAERFRYVRQRADYLRLLVSLITNKATDLTDRHRDETYVALLAWKGQVFRSTAWLRARLHRLTEQEKEKVQDLQAVWASLSRLAFRKTVLSPKVHQKRISDLLSRRDDLEDEVQRMLPGDWRETTLGVAELAARLPAESVLLDLHVHEVWRPGEWRDGKLIRRASWQPPRVSAWVLRSRDSHVRHVDLGPASTLQRAVEAHLRPFMPRSRTSRSPGGRTPEIKKKDGQASHLRNLLWEPLRKAVADARLVFISPDQFLATLPFETLQERDGSYLIEKHGFVYLQDARSLAKMQAGPRGKSTPPGLLLMGNVDYDARGEAPARARKVVVQASTRGAGLDVWIPLGNTALEVAAIARLHRLEFGKEASRLQLEGLKATEEQLKTSLPGNQIVHLATHGFFKPKGHLSLLDAAKQEAEQNKGRMIDSIFRQQRALAGQLPGLLTGLVCAGANLPRDDKRDDGLLTAEEVAWLDLKACDLVVLSACSTALGVAREGEALMSLRRAFRQAGARTVISSLWDVPDTSTRELMQEFYGRLWKKGERRITKLEALRGAQLAILKRNKAKYGKALPHKWGMFVLSGDWR